MLRIITFLFTLLIIAIAVTASGNFWPELFQLSHAIPMGDKVIHFLFLGTLSLLLNLNFGVPTFRFANRDWMKITWILIGIMFLEECSQMYFPHRSFSLGDMTANTLGIWLFGKWAQHIHGKWGKAKKSTTSQV
ncbi:VanZ family protein [Pontibacter sp. G13]|uniref:VanZ family protein n=1 Tax=Pontibacter sp. G13 TaxID=3074898 RepID=UPI00288BABCC|nr:VanZ family protein [Pontibacter sp. G13]WNJ16359.1 VanZ family protein [Pontibacter sp. G13]